MWVSPSSVRRVLFLADKADKHFRPLTRPGRSQRKPFPDWVDYKPNSIWIYDTYVTLDTDGFGYTAFVVDAYAGLIRGWECSMAKDTSFVWGRAIPPMLGPQHVEILDGDRGHRPPALVYGCDGWGIPGPEIVRDIGEYMSRYDNPAGPCLDEVVQAAPQAGPQPGQSDGVATD